MVKLDAFLAGDVSVDFPDERATCRYEQATGTVIRRFDDAMKLLSPAC
jgi:hypothetical protein